MLADAYEPGVESISMTQRSLNLVHRETHAVALPPPRFTVSLSRDVLQVEFTVPRADRYVNSRLPFGTSADKLWEHDVVEVFVSLAKREEDVTTAPYLEFQVSPLGQFFELRILEPRKRVETNPQLGLVASAKTLPQEWTARFEIPLAKHISPVDQACVFGNLFSILGPPGKKEFWSWFTPPQSRPDFHIPAHFKRLLIEA
jgi:hypothetical protein